MRLNVTKVAAVAGLVAAFWVMPSVGTRGQGTLGDRFVHVDRMLVGNTAEDRQTLLQADQIATAAVAGL